MARINLQDFSKTIGPDSDPFDFNLYLSICNDGEMDDSNPFKNDKSFLCKLIEHFEQEEKIDVCLKLKSLLRQIN